jgi:ABC-type branched-subunit amino acid transport system ATPase component
MALEVADRAYVMNRGRLAMQGCAEDLLADQDLLVASYMGGDELDQ